MLRTEMRNERSMHIDRMDTLDMLRLMNDENRRFRLLFFRSVDRPCQTLIHIIFSCCYFLTNSLYHNAKERDL